MEYQIITHFQTNGIYFKYIRYMDDCFVITKVEQKIVWTVKYFHRAIIFTKEIESNGQIAIIYVLNKRNNNIFLT